MKVERGACPIVPKWVEQRDRPRVPLTGYELDSERVKEIQAVNGMRKDATVDGMAVEEAMEKYPSR